MKKQYGLILLSLFLGSLLLIACGRSDNSLDGTNSNEEITSSEHYQVSSLSKHTRMKKLLVNYHR